MAAAACPLWTRCACCGSRAVYIVSDDLIIEDLSDHIGGLEWRLSERRQRIAGALVAVKADVRGQRRRRLDLARQADAMSRGCGQWAAVDLMSVAVN